MSANEPYFMTYYKNIALLQNLYNKESLFFCHLLSTADKDLIVNLTKYQKEKIVRLIGSKSKNPSNIAKQYISKLVKLGLILSVGGGSYKVNPSIHGFSAGSDYLEKMKHNYAEIRIKMRPDKDAEITAFTGEILKDENGHEYILATNGVRKSV